MTWRVNREAAIFLGAGRALLLQLAHPWVAAAIEQHSDTFADPISRFHRTFSVVFTMVFGRLEQSLHAARRLHRRHAAISGTMQLAAGPFPAGSFYCAIVCHRCGSNGHRIVASVCSTSKNAPPLRWVHATLT